MEDKNNNEEIRERLVRIEAHQTHQIELLQLIKDTSDKAFNKADTAEDVADEALKLAERNEATFSDYLAEEKVERRWLIGLMVTTGLALLPILSNFYL